MHHVINLKSLRRVENRRIDKKGKIRQGVIDVFCQPATVSFS